MLIDICLDDCTADCSLLEVFPVCGADDLLPPAEEAPPDFIPDIDEPPLLMELIMLAVLAILAAA